MRSNSLTRNKDFCKNSLGSRKISKKTLGREPPYFWSIRAEMEGIFRAFLGYFRWFWRVFALFSISSKRKSPKKLSKPGKSVNSISKTDFPQKFVSESRPLWEKKTETRTRVFRGNAMSVYAARSGDFVEHFCRDVSGLSGKFCDALSAGLSSFCCRFCCRSCRLFGLVVLNYLWTGSSKKARFVPVLRGFDPKITVFRGFYAVCLNDYRRDISAVLTVFVPSFGERLSRVLVGFVAVLSRRLRRFCVRLSRMLYAYFAASCKTISNAG